MKRILEMFTVISIIFSTNTMAENKNREIIGIVSHFGFEDKYCFEIPARFGVNFENIARSTIKNMEINKPDQSHVQAMWQNEPGNIFQYPYEAGLPENIKSTRWLIVRLKDVIEIIPSEFIGIITYSYEFNSEPSKYTLYSPSFSGLVCSKHSKDASNPALFSFELNSNESVKNIPFSFNNKGIDVSFLNTVLSINENIDESINRPTQVFEDGDNRKYVVIQWPYSIHGCEASYSIYTEENGKSIELKRVGGSCE